MPARPPKKVREAIKVYEDALAHQVAIERLKSSLIGDYDQKLNQLERKIIAALQEREVGTLDELSQRELETLIKQLRQVQTEVYAEQTNDLTSQLEDLTSYETAREATRLRQWGEARASQIPISNPPAKDSLDFVYKKPVTATGELLKPFLNTVGAAGKRRLEGAVREGHARGETMAEMIRRVRGTKAQNYTDGLTNLDKNAARSVVRTSVQHVSNQALMATWEENSDLVQGYVYVATLDSRTSLSCASLDGQRFKLGKGPVPPIHPNCRSRTIADLGPEFDFLKEGATRSSEDGYVDAKLSYYEWLKRQSPEYVKETLGPRRAELFAAEGMTAEKFARSTVSKYFEPLTLAQMRAADPTLFDGPEPGQDPDPSPAAPAQKGEAFTGTGHHFTSEENTQAIAATGIDTSLAGSTTWQGSGFYMFAEEPPLGSSSFGGVHLKVDYKLKNAFTSDPDALYDKVKELETRLPEPPHFKVENGTMIRITPEEAEKVKAAKGITIQMWGAGKDSKPYALQQLWKEDGYDGIVTLDSAGNARTVAVFDAENLKVTNLPTPTPAAPPVGINKVSDDLLALIPADVSQFDSTDATRDIVRREEPSIPIVVGPPRGSRIRGEEHYAEIRGDEIVKSTFYQDFGFTTALDAEGKTIVKSASVREYLMRMKYSNEVFGTKIIVLGLSKDGEVITTQPFYTGETPTPEELEEYMVAQGFKKVPPHLDGMVGNSALEGTSYYRESDGYLAMDIRPENGFRLPDGNIQVIDAMIAKVRLDLTDEDPLLNTTPN